MNIFQYFEQIYLLDQLFLTKFSCEDIHIFICKQNTQTNIFGQSFKSFICKQTYSTINLTKNYMH